MKILDIQRMSSEDGPGLRSTVFFKGCPLACRWCHNPESIAFKGEVLWHPARCIGCSSCTQACPQNGLRFGATRLHIPRELCNACFSCCEACPAGALEGKGREAGLDELCRELLKDRAYFGADGGITLSGGEALMQEGAVELLQMLKDSGVHTAIDTCGLVPVERLKRALDYCDMALYDLKLADSARHKEWTGAGNEIILINLQVVAEWGGRLWIRTPIIPGATDDEENIKSIGGILRQYAIERWELCAFNNLCGSKYESLGRPWEFGGVPLQRREDMERLTEIAIQSGACPDTRWTGAVQESGNRR